MNEQKSIIKAYESAKKNQLKVALATVVQVDGSAYRRPGARMLITEAGELTGAISGGCLEGDALRKAQTVIFQQESMLVTYDTTDEDDQKFGIGLGCNGIIHVLIEPINFQDELNPVALLQMAISDREVGVLATVFSVKNARSAQIGTRFLKKGDTYKKKDIGIATPVLEEIESVFSNSDLVKNEILILDDSHSIFIEVIHPPIQLLLFGAGNDTIPVAKMADLLGIEVILIDGRANQATTSRFPTVTKINVSPANFALEGITIDSYTVALLMTHNFEYEATVLETLLSNKLSYVGILGPKKKSEKLRERLETKELQADWSNVYGPIGLDIGAENSEEIALSALSEIKAVLAGKSGTFLRDKQGPIH
ncbi:MAG: XdhC family protein [Algoriphagus sp.]|uniref:XdhC family protein n=1 Tax=Algoriphagus sp. TaxID=1872435 RepID=UPI002606092A|nr:XdhC/CoxI family protein [Algoriphagus sp.]MDG1275972.1 XdhC family protein [Algoriphagus sp.]